MSTNKRGILGRVGRMFATNKPRHDGFNFSPEAYPEGLQNQTGDASQCSTLGQPTGAVAGDNDIEMSCEPSANSPHSAQQSQSSSRTIGPSPVMANHVASAAPPPTMVSSASSRTTANVAAEPPLQTGTGMSSESSSQSQATARQKFASTAGKPCLLAVSKACPPAMMRDMWAVSDYTLQKKLYSSKVSLVYSAVCKRSGATVAVKLYMRSALQDPHKIQAMREISFHCDVCHPRILSMYAAWADNHYIYMILEYADHGDLYRILRYKGPLPESIVVTEVLGPLMEALGYMHELGLVHRDLKPENILITADGIKVADLGLVINDIQEKPNTRLGTLDYMAPEVYLMQRKHHPMQGKDNDSRGYDSKVDVWSVGVIVYELLTGTLPFQQEHVGHTVQAICAVNFRPFPPSMPPLAESFIRSIFKQNPAERPSIKELKMHPWVTHVLDGQYTTNPLPMTAGLPVRGMTNRTNATTAGTWQDLFMRLEPSREDLLAEGRSSQPDVASQIQL